MANDEPLRFLYLHPVKVPDPEANVVQAAETCRALAERGHEVFLIVQKLREETREACLEALGVEPHSRLHLVEEPAVRLKNSSGLASLWVRLGLLWFLKALVKKRRTILYYRTLKDSRLARFMQTASRLLRVPVIYEAHKLYLEKRRGQGFHPGTLRRMDRLERQAVCGSRGVVASHPLLEAALKEQYLTRRPIVVVPNGVRLIRMAEVSREFDAIYAGSLFPWKGVDICLEAVARIEGCRLAVVGGNPAERLVELRARAEELGISERVTFFGQMPRVKAMELVAASAASLIPLAVGHNEGDRFTCPLKMLEAMSLGVPVVAADTPALRCFVEDGETALLYEAGSSESLAECIKRLSAQPDLAKRLQAAGREMAERFSYKARAKSIEEFSRSLLGNRNRDGGP